MKRKNENSKISTTKKTNKFENFEQILFKKEILILKIKILLKKINHVEKNEKSKNEINKLM